VHGRAVGDRLSQRLERPSRIACGEPVAGDLARVAAARAQLLGDRAVQRAPAEPGDGLVDGVAHQRVPEGGGAARRLDEQPAGQQLAEGGLAREAGDEREIHLRAGDRRGLGGRVRVLAERREPHEHGVADGRGQRHVLLQRKIDARRPGRQALGML
jgi:hypothetical protein